MKLLWLKYGTPPKYGLFLYIGDSGNLMILLKSKDMDKAEIRLVRQSMTTLAKLDVGQRMAWLKKYCSRSVAKAYRKFNKSSVGVLKEYLPKG